MGKTPAHRLSENLVVLGRALDRSQRATLERALRGLLAWQRAPRTFPRITRAADATPYVSLYARGKLRGCYGSSEGAPAERVVRAFVRALGDARYGGIQPDERTGLAADVAYVVRARPCRADEAASILEPGVQGAATITDGHATVLIPSVARERGYDAAGFLELLAKKTGEARTGEGIVWVLDMDEVSSRGIRDDDSIGAARRFLESLVDRAGRIAFEIDPSSGEHVHAGAMRHGRIAVAVEALAALGSHRAKPARAWLAREIASALASKAPDGWPDRPDMVLGTLALAARAGLDVPLAEFAARVDLAAASPWHLAQVASVLGPRTPSPLWDACVRSLDARPFSPYALMAAAARGDAPVIERCVRAILATPIRETALTAVAIESLIPIRSVEAKRAVREARAFVLARQILDVPAALHPRTLGAFRASPIAPVLRCDVTAHAALACR